MLNSIEGKLKNKGNIEEKKNKSKTQEYTHVVHPCMYTLTHPVYIHMTSFQLVKSLHINNVIVNMTVKLFLNSFYKIKLQCI